MNLKHTEPDIVSISLCTADQFAALHGHTASMAMFGLQFWIYQLRGGRVVIGQARGDDVEARLAAAKADADRQIAEIREREPGQNGPGHVTFRPCFEVTTSGPWMKA